MRVSKYLWKLRLAKQTNFAELCFQSSVFGFWFGVNCFGDVIRESGQQVDHLAAHCWLCLLFPCARPRPPKPPHLPGVAEAAEFMLVCRFWVGEPTNLSARVVTHTWHCLPRTGPRASSSSLGNCLQCRHTQRKYRNILKVFWNLISNFFYTKYFFVLRNMW